MIYIYIYIYYNNKYNMPNKKGGKSYKKGKKESTGVRTTPIEYREEGEEYAVVKKMLGGGRVTLTLPDNTEKLGIIRGNMKRRGCWIVLNDLVLVALRTYEESKCDILFKYTPTHINLLKKKNHLSPAILNILNNNRTDMEEDDSNVVFDEDEDEELEEKVETINKDIIHDTVIKDEPTLHEYDVNWDEI